MTLLVAGLMNIELSTKVESFPIAYEPVSFLFNQNTLNISGVGYNVMMALHQLGADVKPFSLVGRDLPGEMIINTLDKHGIDTTHIYPILKETPTTTVLVDQKGMRSIYCDLKDIQDQSIAYTSDLSEMDLVILGTTNFSRGLIDQAKKAEKLIAVDVHILSDIHDPYHKDFLTHADIVFFSHEKLTVDPKTFILSLVKTYDINIIVCTLGDQGLLYYTKQTEIIRKINAVWQPKIESTIGAGDALFSSFLYFFLKGHPVEQALRHATFFASYKLGFSGGSQGFLSEKDLITFIKKDENNGLY